MRLHIRSSAPTPDKEPCNLMPHGARRPALATLLLFALAACRTTTPTSVADEELLAVLRQRGSAPVMIALTDPVGQVDPTDLVATRGAVRRLQDEVLRSVDSTDFTLRVRYETIPALAGTLRSERGFRRFKAHPLVRHVSLEMGGGG